MNPKTQRVRSKKPSTTIRLFSERRKYFCSKVMPRYCTWHCYSGSSTWSCITYAKIGDFLKDTKVNHFFTFLSIPRIFFKNIFERHFSIFRWKEKCPRINCKQNCRGKKSLFFRKKLNYNLLLTPIKRRI